MATQDNYPLSFRLVVPEADWTAMRLGNDALNSNAFILEQAQKLFLPRRLGKISENILNANSHSSPSVLCRPFLCQESDLSLLGLRCSHELANGVKDFLKLSVVCFFQCLKFFRQIFVSRQDLSETNESLHDFDIHLNRALTSRNAGQHGNALFRERVRKIFPMSSTTGF